MGTDTRGSAWDWSAAPTGQSPAAGGTGADGRDEGAEAAITALYQDHALGLIRLAHIMLGDRASAEDVVQEAFCGLYRRWAALADQAKALPYVRSSVLNGCRTVLRRSQARDARWGSRRWPVPAPADPAGPDTVAAGSGEAAVLWGEQRHAVMQALRQLPRRQREVLVLRFYLDHSDAEISRDLGISQGTVRSTAHRALVALGHSLGGMQ